VMKRVSSRDSASARVTGVVGAARQSQVMSEQQVAGTAVNWAASCARNALMQSWCLAGFAGSGASPQTLQVWLGLHQSPSYTVFAVIGA
jgi:hypothetical protein